MQDLVGGDYIRIPVKFQGLDNCRIVGGMSGCFNFFEWLLGEDSINTELWED
jgi:hypothetical protein